jgi:hypothetical protein
MQQQVVIGTITGNGAAQNISLGFIPDYVQIANITDGDVVDIWFQGMTTQTSIKIDTAAATRAATDGIAEYAGDATHGAGFTIGAGISENAKVLRYVAMRN